MHHNPVCRLHHRQDLLNIVACDKLNHDPKFPQFPSPFSSSAELHASAGVQLRRNASHECGGVDSSFTTSLTACLSESAEALELSLQAALSDFFR